MLCKRSRIREKGTEPFPTRQLFVLALCRICEPIAFMSIFPYIYFMISSFQISSDDRQISIYAGLVTSAFAFAEFSTGMLWGRLSDRVGRKPILLTGLAGTGLSMLIFGFAPNLPVALLARALGGLLNGNIGVLQTTVAEVVTVEAHQPRAYSIMPFVWCLGSIIGAGLGGTLAEPVKNYPDVFQPGTLFDKFPFLLPNLVCTAVVLFGLVVGILFLEETHEDKKHRKDYGLQLGDWIVRLLFRTSTERVSKEGYFEETLAFLAEDDEPPRYRSTESSPALHCVEASLLEPPPRPLDIPCEKPSASFRTAFTPQVILNIVGYGMLAFHTISLEQLLSILLAQEDGSPEAIHLPFKFIGGFGLPSKTIGFILSVQGVLQMLVQIFVFPILNRRLGSLASFRLVIFAYPLFYVLVPYVPLLPHNLRMPGVYLVILWKVFGQCLSYPSLAIMLANMAPSKRVLGTLNGSAASSASLCRAFGPAVSGIVHSLGMGAGYSGLSWWTIAVVAALGATESLWMKEEKRRPDLKSCAATIPDEEAPFDEHLPAYAPRPMMEPQRFSVEGEPLLDIDNHTKLGALRI